MKSHVEREIEVDAERASRAEERAVSTTVSRYDPFWAPQALLAATILLDLVLSERVTVGPNWLLPSLEALALVALVTASPSPALRRHPMRRRFSLAIIGLVSAANSASLIQLCRQLVGGGPTHGRALLGSGVVLWLTNVLMFSVWYWQLDRGGPVARESGSSALPDFLFVQMSTPEHAPPHWQPGIVDYLYLSFTNATAFSPTDTMPLTAVAKCTMAVQSLTALVTIGLVVARAVNIL